MAHRRPFLLRRVVLVLLLVFAGAASGEVVSGSWTLGVDPARPSNQDVLTLVVRASGCPPEPGLHRLDRVGPEVRLAVRSTDACESSPETVTQRYRFGQLPAGRYTMVYVDYPGLVPPGAAPCFERGRELLFVRSTAPRPVPSASPLVLALGVAWVAGAAIRALARRQVTPAPHA